MRMIIHRRKTTTHAQGLYTCRSRLVQLTLVFQLRFLSNQTRGNTTLCLAPGPDYKDPDDRDFRVYVLPSL